MGQVPSYLYLINALVVKSHRFCRDMSAGVLIPSVKSFLICGGSLILLQFLTEGESEDDQMKIGGSGPYV